MSSGLCIDKSSFKKLNNSNQMGLLFQNTQDIKELLSTVKFNQKIQYAWLFLLSALFGYKKYIPI